MNIRKSIYFGLVRLRGQELASYYKRFLQEDSIGISTDITKRQLVHLLTHCKQFVPYYAEIMREIGGSFSEDPEDYLRRFPILTKDTIRSRFDALKSTDLPQRKWYINSSSGSTGEQIEFIQDWEYAAKAGAIKLFYQKLLGRGWCI